MSEDKEYARAWVLVGQLREATLLGNRRNLAREIIRNMAPNQMRIALSDILGDRTEPIEAAKTAVTYPARQ